MQNRIEGLRKIVDEEKAAAAAEKTRQEQEAVRIVEERRQAEINSPKHQALLAFVNGEEVRKALKEIWDYSIAGKPVEITVPGFLGPKKKNVPQIPFEIFVNDLPRHSELTFGFKYLASELKYLASEHRGINTLESNVVEKKLSLGVMHIDGKIKIFYSIGESGMDYDSGSTTYTFNTMEEYLNHVARNWISRS